MSVYMQSNLIPKVGNVFGLWVVLVPGTIDCRCRCGCGIEKNVRTRNLIDGKSTRCGSCASKVKGKRLWDDKQPRKLRKAVKAAIERCTKPNHQVYRNYGGRGIKIHDEWLKDPRLFVEYLSTLDGCNNPKLVLDRINNDSHYEPGNLRFVDYSMSRRNQRGV